MARRCRLSFMRRFWNHTCGDSRATARVRVRWVFPVPAQSLQTLSPSQGSLAYYFPGSVPLLSRMGQGAQKLAGLLEHTLYSQKNLLLCLMHSSGSDSTLAFFFPPPKPTFYLPLSTHHRCPASLNTGLSIPGFARGFRAAFEERLSPVFLRGSGSRS